MKSRIIAKINNIYIYIIDKKVSDVYRRTNTYLYIKKNYFSRKTQELVK